MKKIVLIISISLLSFANNGIIIAQNKSVGNFHKLQKLFVVGNFDGDKKPDTIFQHNFSNLTKKRN